MDAAMWSGFKHVKCANAELVVGRMWGLWLGRGGGWLLSTSSDQMFNEAARLATQQPCG